MTPHDIFVGKDVLGQQPLQLCFELLLFNPWAIYTLCDVVALLAGQRICNSQVAGSSHGWAPLHSGQATYTCVPLSPSSIIWYQPWG